MAFVSSRQNPNISVANRFFGLKPDGDYKIRGIACRREDTPLSIAEAQLRVLQILSKENDHKKLQMLFPEVLNLLQDIIFALNNRTIPVSEMVVTQTLSRELTEYRVPSPVARAASQLQAIGKEVHMGQRIQFVYTRTKEGVWAWDLPGTIQSSYIDTARYKELLFRAVFEILQPMGVTESVLRNWMFSQASYIVPRGYLHNKLAMPLFTNLKHVHVDVL